MGFQSLLDIISKARGKYPALSQRFKEVEAIARWEKAVGPHIAKHARALRVVEGTLWIEVDHPIWKAELHARKRQILEILNTPQENEGGDNNPNGETGPSGKAPQRPSAATDKNQAKRRPAGAPVLADLFFVDMRSGTRR